MLSCLTSQTENAAVVELNEGMNIKTRHNSFHTNAPLSKYFEAIITAVFRIPSDI